MNEGGYDEDRLVIEVAVGETSADFRISSNCEVRFYLPVQAPGFASAALVVWYLIAGAL